MDWLLRVFGLSGIAEFTEIDTIVHNLTTVFYTAGAMLKEDLALRVADKDKPPAMAEHKPLI